MFERIFNNKRFIQIIAIIVIIFSLTACTDTNNGKSAYNNDSDLSFEEPLDTGDEESGNTTVPEESRPEESKNSINAASSYIGLTVNDVKELIGEDYVVVNGWNSTGFYFEDVSIFFLIGELLPEGQKLTGNEVVKYIEVYDGQILPGVYVGDTAESIANTLNMDNPILEYSEASVSEGDPPYELCFDTEINGYDSSVYFYFSSADPGAVCEYAYIKAHELY